MIPSHEPRAIRFADGKMVWRSSTPLPMASPTMLAMPVMFPPLTSPLFLEDYAVFALGQSQASAAPVKDVIRRAVGADEPAFEAAMCAAAKDKRRQRPQFLGRAPDAERKK